MEKPPSLYDRDDEWADLIGFVTGAGPPVRLGIVYGRRRFGKSWLLRRLVESVGGVYHLALQEERRPALDRFAAALSRSQEGSPPLRFDDWSAALGYAAAMLAGRGAGPQALVLDEYPYLRRACPELDSTVQALFDEAASGEPGPGRRPPVAVIVCGSAMSVMTGVLSGASPMWGRAALDMPLAAFDFRRARGFWGVEDPGTAFMVDSIVGGAAGYKDLTAAAAGAPACPDDAAGWLAATVLNPSHALFREDEYLLRAEPRITAEAPYYSLLQAIAEGNRSQGRIAAAVGRRSGDIVHHLGLMTGAGFVVREDDLLTARRPSYRIADPIVRFHHLVTRRHMALLEDRRAEEVWSGAAGAYRSKMAGPHFETVCRRWVNRYASPETLGGPIGAASRLQVNDRSRRRSFELNVAALARSEGGGGQGTVVQVIGEAKAGRMDASDLARLDRIAGLAAERKGMAAAPGLKRLLFSLEGFDAELSAAARRRPDVELIDPARLYEGS